MPAATRPGNEQMQVKSFSFLPAPKMIHVLAPLPLT
jgi:hypothetical protein